MDHEVTDDIRVVQINAGDDEGVDITFEYNTKRITVSIFACPSSNGGDCCSSLGAAPPMETRIIRLLNEAVVADDEDYEHLIDEVVDDLVLVGADSFSEAAPPVHQPPPAAGQDLQSLLYPEALHFRLQTINGEATIFRIRPDEGVSLSDVPPEPQPSTAFQPDDQLPCYSASNVLVQDILVRGNGIVGRVQVGGRDVLCKARRVGLSDPGLEQELATLQKLGQATVRTDVPIRVPSLHGYITHADSGAVIGLLREWVPSGSYGQTLRDVNVPAVPLAIRQKWADQMRQTVARLHSIGIVWGDGKPSNVIVDQRDDIQLIDFAGGWSRGWVDEQLAGTAEGDDQAVRRIMQLLGV